MLMSRRVPAPWGETLRLAVWPRRSWGRSLRYVRLRARRLKAVPRSIALGAAAGVFVAILPIPGLQLLAAAGLAWLVQGHRGAAALATFAANPVTYPLIWLASYVTGATLLGTPVSDAAHDLDALTDLMAQPWSPAAAPRTSQAWAAALPILATLALGALPLALLAAIAAYYGVRGMLRPMAARDVTRSRARPQLVPARRGISRQLATRRQHQMMQTARGFRAAA